MCQTIDRTFKKTFEIEKMPFQHEEIEAQYRVELAELAISLEEMADLYEIQNTANNKINLKS